MEYGCYKKLFDHMVQKDPPKIDLIGLFWERSIFIKIIKAVQTVELCTYYFSEVCVYEGIYSAT